MAKWEATYMYYNGDQARRVLKSLKRDGVKVKMTSRKLAKHEGEKRNGATRLYTIYRHL